MTTWKELLADQIPDTMGNLIDTFEAQIELRKQGKLDEKVFAEQRLRKGAYGQRYDNGQRHDGVQPRELSYPSGGLVKGPDTLWDAPGMQRIKIPLRRIDGASNWKCFPSWPMNTPMASCISPRARTFNCITCTLTIRRIMMRRLAAVGITTQEACGNSVRNITACTLGGCLSRRGL